MCVCVCVLICLVVDDGVALGVVALVAEQRIKEEKYLALFLFFVLFQRIVRLGKHA